jgi:hypothetical protein
MQKFQMRNERRIMYNETFQLNGRKEICWSVQLQIRKHLQISIER